MIAVRYRSSLVTRIGRWMCTMVSLLAMLAGPVAVVAPAKPCPRCTTHCPMHAPGLHCHDGARLSCHDAPGVARFTQCDHGADPNGIAAPVWRAIVPALVMLGDLPPTEVVDADDSGAGAFAFLEPPTEPPRSAFVVS
jgi:hypothetical protein